MSRINAAMFAGVVAALTSHGQVIWQDADPCTAASDVHSFYSVVPGTADPAGGGATVGRAFYPDPTHPEYRNAGINGDNNGFGTAGSGTHVSSPLGGAYQYANIESGYLGQPFSYSADVYVPTGSSLGNDVDDTLSIFIRWQNATGSNLVTTAAGEANLGLRDAWQTLTISGTSPGDPAVTRVLPVFAVRDAATNVPQNEILYFVRNIDFQLSGTNSPPPPPGTGVYQETGGLVVMEAERADLVGAWVSRPSTPVNDPTMAGSLGDGWLEWTGAQYTGNTITPAQAHGILSYKFNISMPGDYIFRWRTKQYNAGQANDAGNDTFVRFASGTPPAGYQDFSNFSKVYIQSKTAWSWTTTFEPQHAVFYGNGLARRTFAAGMHEIQFAARSPGHSIDRLVLHHTSVPFNQSNFESAPESPRAGGPPYTYEAITDFPSLNGGEVNYYVDAARSALAIDASVVANRGKFARASVTFTNAPGAFDATITALRELDGECVYRLLVNGVVVGAATNSTTAVDYAPQDHVFPNITMPAGATVAVESNTDSNGQVPEGGGFAWARGRWTRLVLDTAGAVGPPAIAGVVLVNADTDTDIGPLTDGAVLNLGTLPTTNLNIRADTTPATIGSVRFVLNGGAYTRTEDVAPYACFTDVSGDYQPWTPPLGAHTLVVTPYASAGATGTAGSAVTLNFTAVNPGVPTVHAGPDKVVVLPTNSVVLTGSATDNGTITNLTWTQQSGPNTASLAGVSTTVLTASDLVQGTYVFRLAATDNEGNTANDEASVVVVPEGGGQAVITGEFKKWHKVTLSFTGPTTSETATPNPFADYRLDVTFAHPGSGKSYVVPGFYAGDGDAANTSATFGNVWRAHFAPDEEGLWTYSASFRAGTDVAVGAVGGGSSAGYFDGDSGNVVILATDKTGRDLRGKGRLRYVGKHHLQFAETGEYFLKAGADSPENFLAYADFDSTPNVGARRKSWAPHAADYHAADASIYTWQSGKGSEMLGAVRYLSDKGMNVFSFLTFSLDGDDDNVFPHLLKGTLAAYEGVADNQRWSNANGVHQDRFDVSKMDQWERIFEYAGKKGMYLHFKTQETENDQKMDGGAVGRTRKLYYRELIARYAHHLALNWNCGEENTNTEQQRKDMAQYFYDTDPYRHHVVLHTFPDQQNSVYPALLGNASKYTGASVQTSPASVFSDTLKWRTDSANAGKPWVVANDEQGSANIGIDCDSADFNHDSVRKNVLWGNMMAGGAGIEAYYGYQTCSTDLTSQDHRTRDNWWNMCRHALTFFNDNAVPFWDMSNQDNLVSGASGAQCLRKTGQWYVVYLPNGGTPTLNLAGAGGVFQVRWFDPRNGGALQTGSVLSVPGGSPVSLGAAPNSPASDWVVLVSPGVPGQNFPPQVNAGADQNQVLFSRESLSVVLPGTVTDDGLPGGSTVTSGWSRTSGPAAVTFGDATRPYTVATFTFPGTYVLRLTASDGSLTGFDEVTITLGSTVGGQELTFSPVDDAYLQGTAGTLFNTADLRVEVNNRVSYLKFTVNNATGVVGATLKVSEGNDVGNGTFNLFAGSHNTWTETTLSNATKPVKVGGALDSYVGNVVDGQTISFDVGAFATGNGTYSFVFEHAAGNDVSFVSKEGAAALAPKLVLNLPNTPPSVSITEPMNATTVAANTPVTVTASATDAEGAVATMELFVNGASAGSKAGGGNSWALGALPAGPHSLVVVATDASGTVASSSVTISVVPNGFAIGATLQPTGLVLTWNTVPGLYYRTWYIDDLSDTNWIALGTAVEAMSSVLSETNSPSLAPQRFYRIEEQTSP